MQNTVFKYIFGLSSVVFLLLEVNPLDDFNAVSYAYLPNVFQTEWVLTEDFQQSNISETNLHAQKNSLSTKGFSFFMIKKIDLTNHNYFKTHLQKQSIAIFSFKKSTIHNISHIILNNQENHIS